MRSGVITSRTETRVAVAQDVVHRDEVGDEPLDLAHHVLVGQPQVEERARERARRRQQLRLAAHQLPQPPARGLREREQPQRLAGRRAVDDDDVPLAVLDVALEPQQAEQLVAARRHRQLLGGDPLDAALDQHLAEPALHRGPVALELLLRGDLLRPEVARQLGRLARRPAPRARRRASGRDRWRARPCAARRRRSGGRWRRRPTSCRRRPCPCRGSCAGPSTARSLLAAALRLEHLDACPRAAPRCPARSVAAIRTV